MPDSYQTAALPGQSLKADPSGVSAFMRDYRRIVGSITGIDELSKALLVNRILFEQLAPKDNGRVIYDTVCSGLDILTARLPLPADVVSEPEILTLADWAAKLGDAVLAIAIEHGSSNRRKRGAWFTPEPVARSMCRRALLEYLEIESEELTSRDKLKVSVDRARALVARLQPIRVVDPACGGGVFLLVMLAEIERLLTTLFKTAEMTFSEETELRGEILKANLHGVDVDPLAVLVTRQRLWLAVSSTGSEPDAWVRNIVCGDGLAPVDDTRRYHIVVTNPPYGVTVPPVIRNRLFPVRQGSQSRDAYGLFIAQALELLDPKGVAALLVADTWRTIRSHLPLRKRLLAESRIVSVMTLPARLFDATVSTCILVLQKTDEVADHVIEVGAIGPDAFAGSTPRTGNGRTFRYGQSLLARYELAPVFIASPRLFEIVADERLPRLGDIAQVRHGLTTGATRSFVYKEPGTPGPYRVVEPRRVFDVTRYGARLSTDERQHGLDPEKYGGTYLVPYDKGGAADSATGWVPCYHVPTRYYIDWRRESVGRMKTLPGFRHDGRQFYFRRGITFSHTGMYAPTFRIGCGGVFDTAGSSLFTEDMDLRVLLAILNSKLIKYLFKNYINHSVNTSEGPLKQIPIVEPSTDVSRQLTGLVDTIVEKQRQGLRYPFQRTEQPEIDRLVYRLYGLGDTEVSEVENWYRHRYPRLFAGPLDPARK